MFIGKTSHFVVVTILLTNKIVDQFNLKSRFDSFKLGES
jgi:hypothetical protein